MLRHGQMGESADIAGFIDPLLKKLSGPKAANPEIARLCETVAGISKPLHDVLAEEFPHNFPFSRGPQGEKVCGPATALSTAYLRSVGYDARAVAVVKASTAFGWLWYEGMNDESEVPDVLTEKALGKLNFMEMKDIDHHTHAMTGLKIPGLRTPLFVDFAHRQFDFRAGEFVIDALRSDVLRQE